MADIAVTGDDHISAFRLSAYLGVPKFKENTRLLDAVINNNTYTLFLCGWLDGSELDSGEEFDSDTVSANILRDLELSTHVSESYDIQQVPYFEWISNKEEEPVGDLLDFIPLSPHKVIHDLEEYLQKNNPQ